MDKKNYKVVGIQKEDGTVDHLTVKEIEVCRKYGLPFQVPEHIENLQMDEELTKEEYADIDEMSDCDNHEE